ncbi:hypothetical protein SDC9_205116 [bioreactor metagenome]|uniref:Uncharacterized protein n=1 Tax=bioreactor metagenome TaxID=1076179 RepID=A0A645J2U4_9ZZZZ
MVVLLLAGNFVIDSVVVMICYYIFHVRNIENIKLCTFYKNSILKVWLLGYVADLIGVFACVIVSFLPYLVFSVTGFNNTPYYTDDFVLGCNIVIMVIGMIVASWFIYYFNYNNIFHFIEYKPLRKKIAIMIAIATTPWTLLLQIDQYGMLI